MPFDMFQHKFSFAATFNRPSVRTRFLKRSPLSYPIGRGLIPAGRVVGAPTCTHQEPRCKHNPLSVQVFPLNGLISAEIIAIGHVSQHFAHLSNPLFPILDNPRLTLQVFRSPIPSLTALVGREIGAFFRSWSTIPGTRPGTAYSWRKRKKWKLWINLLA